MAFRVIFDPIKSKDPRHLRIAWSCFLMNATMGQRMKCPFLAIFGWNKANSVQIGTGLGAAGLIRLKRRYCDLAPRFYDPKIGWGNESSFPFWVPLNQNKSCVIGFAFSRICWLDRAITNEPTRKRRWKAIDAWLSAPATAREFENNDDFWFFFVS